MPCSKSIAAVTAVAASIATPAFAIDTARSTEQLEAGCAALSNMSIAAKTIGLPTHGATISSAELASLASPADAPARYCKVLGAIAPVDQDAYPINFEVNMPLAWNSRAVQYGGGGYNGVLITGLEPLRDQPPDLPSPLGRGFMTFGTDSGHRSKDLPEIMAFALNNEALINFAYASYKKTRDVALAVSTTFYGRKPDHLYFFGGSEGGREGLTMAQRFPNDYDGIVSVVPVINWVALQSIGNRSGIVQQNGGWMNRAKLTLVRKAVVAACDADDGLADGIISQYERCSQKFDPVGLRCADGKDTGDSCLSDVQLKALKALHSPFTFDFALINGVRSYPPYNYGHEDQPGAMEDWVTGPKAAEFPLPAPDQQGRQWYYGSGAVRYFFAKDPGYNSLNFDPNKFRARILEISALMDSTNPDLSAFRRHGGRLIIKENGNDFAQSANAGIGYYKSVVARMGQNSVDRFLRLYVTPGANHAGVGVSGSDGSPVPNAVDLLGAIDDWVVKGKAPDVLTQKAQGNAAPFGVLGSRPLCRYPLYPHYEGGAPKDAASFVCRTQAAAPGRMSSHDH